MLSVLSFEHAPFMTVSADTLIDNRVMSPLLLKHMLKVFLHGLNLILVEGHRAQQVLVVLLRQATQDIDVSFAESPVHHRATLQVVKLM